MRKMFTVGLAAVMAMGLCACGSQKATETTAAPAAGEEKTPPPLICPCGGRDNSRPGPGRKERRKGRDHRGTGLF